VDIKVVKKALQILKEADDKKKPDFSKVHTGAQLLKPDDDVNAVIATRALLKASEGETLNEQERSALDQYIDLFITLLSVPNLRSHLKSMQNTLKRQAEKTKKDDDAAEEDK